MTLSIITINRNNAPGLEETLKSVASQTSKEFEHVIVDGASTDASVEIIKRYAESLGDRVKWISEPDKGIYNAMNKGIGMAQGAYVQFLNSGDCLASDNVVERMLEALEKNGRPGILYGNMIKLKPDGSRERDKGPEGRQIIFIDFYTGTLNHSSAYIRKGLFDNYGLYDEKLKIVSDWKWYLQTIILGEEIPAYADIDVTLFDMTGISMTNLPLRQAERDQVLRELIPSSIISEYRDYSFPYLQIQRIMRHPWAYRIVWFIERCLFKIEKRHYKRQ